MGPQAVSPSFRTRKCGLGSLGRVSTPAQPRSSGRLRGRCALPTHAIISVYPIPRGLRALALSLGPLCPRRVARGSGLRCERQSSPALVGRRERDPGNSGTGFSSAWCAGACAQKSGSGQGTSRTQKLRLGWRLNSALKTLSRQSQGLLCFALGSGCSRKGSCLPTNCMTLDMPLLDSLIRRG